MSPYARTRRCNEAEVAALVEYLRFCFGGQSIPAPEEEAHRVVFRSASPHEAHDAIEALVLVHPWRPSPHQVAQRIRAQRRAAAPEPEVPYDEPDPSAASRWLAHCRRVLSEAVPRRPHA